MFQFVAINPGSDPEPIRRSNGMLRTLKTGKKAGRFAAIMSAKTGRKVQPRRFAMDDWRKREQARFADGIYQTLPWAAEGWWLSLIKTPPCKDHFAHISAKHPGRVAYTENDGKGMADIQTPLKAGRYLKRFAGKVLSETVIASLSARFSAQYESNMLQFAETREDIRDVYERGPASCMSSKVEVYASRPVHPAEAYASGELAIAYLERDGRVTARALVRKSNKEIGRMYGDADRLRSLLNADGYVAHSARNLIGAKLLKIVHRKGGFVMPFIDNLYRVVDCGTHFEISDGQERDRERARKVMCADSTSGLIGDFKNSNDVQCIACDEYVDADSVVSDVSGNGYWCSDCVEHQCARCSRASAFGNDFFDVVVSGGDTASWCRICAANYALRTQDRGLVEARAWRDLGHTAYCYACDQRWLDRAAFSCARLQLTPCTAVVGTAPATPPQPGTAAAAPTTRRVLRTLGYVPCDDGERCDICYRDEIEI